MERKPKKAKEEVAKKKPLRKSKPSKLINCAAVSGHSCFWG